MKRYITTNMSIALSEDGDFLALAVSLDPKIAQQHLKKACEPHGSKMTTRTANALLVFDDDGAEMAPYLDTSTIPDEQLAAVDGLLMGKPVCLSNEHHEQGIALADQLAAWAKEHPDAGEVLFLLGRAAARLRMNAANPLLFCMLPPPKT